jgi:hypothetical protein
LRAGTLQRRFTMCWVLEEEHHEWALEFVSPMLTDKRSGFPGETRRLCDVAAIVLSQIHQELEFDSTGHEEERERQIEQMRKQITRRKKD